MQPIIRGEKKLTLKQFIKELNGNRVEGELIKTVLYSLMISTAILILLYIFRFQFITDFFDRQGYFLFFAALQYALITPLVRQVRAYKEFPCMTGMMIGMTSGMISGFMSGFLTSATNGMFYGSVFGMALGMFIGVWMGRCCGIMGVMEGIMAGFMGGLMGGMTALMLLNENLHAATIIIFLVSATIIILLNYLIYHEMKETEKQKQQDHTLTIALTALFILATSWLMAFGPRSALFS